MLRSRVLSTFVLKKVPVHTDTRHLCEIDPVHQRSSGRVLWIARPMTK